MWSYILRISAVVMLLGQRVDANPTLVETVTGTRAAEDGLQLRILHTNDMHARFEQTSQSSATCSASDAASGSCYGGFARVATVVREARNGTVPALFLNAGDTYQGSVWFTAHRWKIVARFLNILAPDAISLGNHEFDMGVAGLIPFLENVTFPVLAANLNLTEEPELAETKLAKSTILTVNGTQIGVIGYLTPETTTLSTTGNVLFNDEVASIDEEAKRLKALGVNILIALGHSGFETDKKIAAEVEDIDLVIGGHTNTFLYNGTLPDSEVAEGFYPTVIQQASGRTTYAVQAYAYTKYVGDLSIVFDCEGEITNITGTPILLDSSVVQAMDVLEELENWREDVENLASTIVGSTRVLLDGDSANCRRRECNMGNLITDAMIDYNSRQYGGSSGWTDAAIAVITAGAIGASITRSNDDQITQADVLAVLPYEDVVYKADMTGAQILAMLEHSVNDITLETTAYLPGAFLQFSGLQVTYDIDQPSGSRVVSAAVRCANCSIPELSTLSETDTYTVLINDWMRSGGDGYSMLTTLEYTSLGITIDDILVDYLGLRSPVYPSVEWRINIAEYDETDTGSNAIYTGCSLMTLLSTLLVLKMLT